MGKRWENDRTERRETRERWGWRGREKGSEMGQGETEVERKMDRELKMEERGSYAEVKIGRHW